MNGTNEVERALAGYGWTPSAFTITEADPNVTFAANTANVAGDVYTYVNPDDQYLVLNTGEVVFGLLQDAAGPTEIDDTSTILIEARDASNITRKTVANLTYQQITEVRDINSLYKLRGKTILEPRQQLVWVITADLVIATAQSNISMSAVRVNRALNLVAAL